MRKVFKNTLVNPNMKYIFFITTAVIILSVIASAELNVGINNIASPKVVIPGTASSSSLDWADITNFPASCAAGNFVTGVGGTLTCASPSAVSGLDVKINRTGDNMTGELGFLKKEFDEDGARFYDNVQLKFGNSSNFTMSFNPATHTFLFGSDEYSSSPTDILERGQTADTDSGKEGGKIILQGGTGAEMDTGDGKKGGNVTLQSGQGGLGTNRGASGDINLIIPEGTGKIYVQGNSSFQGTTDFNHNVVNNISTIYTDYISSSKNDTVSFPQGFWIATGTSWVYGGEDFANGQVAMTAVDNTFYFTASPSATTPITLFNFPYANLQVDHNISAKYFCNLAGDCWNSSSGGAYNSTYHATSADVTANRSAWFSTYNSSYLTGNIFDQNLNTTNNVTFGKVTTPYLNVSDGTSQIEMYIDNDRGRNVIASIDPSTAETLSMLVGLTLYPSKYNSFDPNLQFFKDTTEVNLASFIYESATNTFAISADADTKIEFRSIFNYPSVGFLVNPSIYQTTGTSMSNLSILAANTTGNNKRGGSLILSSGASTGNLGSEIVLKTAQASGSGTTARIPSNTLVLGLPTSTFYSNIIVNSNVTASVYHGMIDWIYTPIGITGTAQCDAYDGKVAGYSYTCQTCIDVAGATVTCGTTSVALQNCGCKID